MNMVGQSDVFVSYIRQNIMESDEVLEADAGRRTPPPQEKKKEENASSLFRSASSNSFQPRHKNSKNLFVLNISRERVVSYEVVHRDERKRWFVSIGPRNRPMSGGIRIMVGSRAGWS